MLWINCGMGHDAWPRDSCDSWSQAAPMDGCQWPNGDQSGCFLSKGIREVCHAQLHIQNFPGLTNIILRCLLAIVITGPSRETLLVFLGSQLHPRFLPCFTRDLCDLLILHLHLNVAMSGHGWCCLLIPAVIGAWLQHVCNRPWQIHSSALWKYGHCYQ